MKRRKIALVAAAVMCLTVFLPVLAACDDATGTVAGGGQDKLVVYNWEDYIDDGLLDEFSEYYRSVTGNTIDITYSTFDTNETMLTQVTKGETAVDVICPSEYAIEKLMTAGLVVNQKELMAELRAEYPDIELFNNIPNIEQAVLDKIEKTFGEMQIGDGVYNMLDYMVPYMWGTLGLLYNTRVVSEEELEEYGWGLLWNAGNNPELENMILMKDSVRDSYAAVVFYMAEYGLLPDGVSDTYGVPYDELDMNQLINCTDTALLEKAESLLVEQRDHISGYEVDFGKDDMINEIVYLDLAWSGDALWAVEESEYYEDTDTYQLGYYVPPSGTNLWFDGWVVTRNSRNKLAAMMFVDYMCRPESAARNIGTIGYTSAVDRELLRSDPDATNALLDVEYLWYASSEECEIFDLNGEMVFRYEWVEGEEYFLDLYGNEVEVEDESALIPLEIPTDEDGYYYLPESMKEDYIVESDYIICPDSISLFYGDEGRYPTLEGEDAMPFGVMRDYGTANESVVNMWQRAKAGDGVPVELWWCLLAIVLFVGVFVGVYFFKEKLRAKPRKAHTAEPPSDSAQ